MTPTREQVRKLARDADIIDWRDEDGDQHVEQMIDSLMVIWQAARAQALEDAAGVCDKIETDSHTTIFLGATDEYLDGRAMGANVCKGAIRALKGKP
jgi:hypothetical protein